MKPRLENALSFVVAACAVAVAGVYVYAQAFAPNPDEFRNPKPTFVDNWKTLHEGGLRIGRQSAPVQIVEFGDFECPFCKTFHGDIERIIGEFDGQVALVYYHFPLPTHPHAEAAARAATCAADQDRFAEMARALYAHQDSLGEIPWGRYASAAGVGDSSSFATCMSLETTVERVSRDKAVGTQLAVKATPTLIVNGWRFAMPPLPDTLRYIVREVIAGRSPFPK